MIGFLRKKPQPSLDKVVWLRLITVLVTIGGLAALAPVIWSAASAAVGLGVLVGLGLVGYAIFYSLPYLGQVLENKLLELRKAEARRRPIEQLQNYLLQRQKQVAAFREAVKKINVAIESMERIIEQRRQANPEADVSKQLQTVAKMKEFYASRRKKYKAAEDALQEIQKAIEDAQFELAFATAGQEALSSMDELNGEQLMEKMLAGEAHSAIRDRFSRVFAELDLEVDEINRHNQLEFDNERIDLSGVHIPSVKEFSRVGA